MSAPLSAPARTRRSATGSPPSTRGLADAMSAPISARLSRSPVRDGLMPTLVDRHLGPRHDQRRDERERRRGRVAGHADRRRDEFGLALDRDAPARRPPAARPRSARRNGRACARYGRGSVCGLDDGGLAGRVEPGEQHRRFDLRRRHRQSVLCRRRVRARRSPRAAAGRPRGCGTGAEARQRRR